MSEGKPALKAVQHPRPLEPEPPDERGVTERAIEAWEQDRLERVQTEETQLETEAEISRQWLGAAFGTDKAEWEYLDGNLNPAGGRALTEWRPLGQEGWRLAVVREGLGNRAQRVVFVAAECPTGDHEPYAVSSPLGPRLSDLGEILGQRDDWPGCPACEDAELSGEAKEQSEFEVIGRALVAAVAMTVRAKIEADQQAQP